MLPGASEAPSLGAIAVVMGAFAQLFGYPGEAILFAAAGGVFGSLLAQPAGPIRHACMFVAAAILSGLFGTLIAEHHSLSQRWADGLSAVIAMAFYPIFGALARVAPDIVGAIADKVSAVVGKKGNP